MIDDGLVSRVVRFDQLVPFQLVTSNRSFSSSRCAPIIVPSPARAVCTQKASLILEPGNGPDHVDVANV